MGRVREEPRPPGADLTSLAFRFLGYDATSRVYRRPVPTLHVNLDERGPIQRAWVARANSLIRAAMDAIEPFELEPGRRTLPSHAAVPFPFHPNRVLDDGGVT